MDNEQYIKQLIDGVKERLEKSETDVAKRLEKHENAISDIKEEVNLLKLSDVEVKVKLSNIELSQEQIKNMINETSRDSQKVTLQLIDAFKETKNEDNKIKLMDRKEIWGIAGILVTALLTYLGLKWEKGLVDETY